MEFSITSVHLPFCPGCKRIPHLLLVLRITVVLTKCPRLLLPSFVMLMILAQWVQRMNQNHLLQCHLGVRLCLLISDIEALTPNSWDDKDPWLTRNELFCPYSLLLRSPLFFVSDFLTAAVPVFFSKLPILFPLQPSHLVFVMLEASEKLRDRDVMVQWIYSFCRNVIFVIPVRHTFQSYPYRFVGIDNTSIFGLAFLNTPAGLTAAICWCFTKHCCWHRNFLLSTSVFQSVFKILHHLVQWRRYRVIVWH